MSGDGRRVVVVGQGYVGLPLSVAAVAAGHQVVALDTDSSRVAALATGRSYVEDVSDTVLRAALSSGRFVPTGDRQACHDFDVAVICVPTPLTDGSPDLSLVERAARDIAPHLRRGSLVVLESTTYPGTTEDVLRPLLEKGSDLVAGADFHLAYSPERIDPGNHGWRLENTPKLVAGLDAASLAVAIDFYSGITATVVPTATIRVAELAKLLENTFRHVNIALVNEFAMLSDELGIGIRDVVAAAATKPFGFMPFTPGPGVGGHCLPIDPAYLSWWARRSTGRDLQLVRAATEINDAMPGYVVRRLVHGLGSRGISPAGAQVLVLGLAYKRNTSDARESPATAIVRSLNRAGFVVTAVDDLVDRRHLADLASRVDLTAETVATVDAVLLVTDHDGPDYDLVCRHARYILDCRHRLTGPTVEHL